MLKSFAERQKNAEFRVKIREKMQKSPEFRVNRGEKMQKSSEDFPQSQKLTDFGFS
jgi:hypothetical protein